MREGHQQFRSIACGPRERLGKYHRAMSRDVATIDAPSVGFLFSLSAERSLDGTARRYDVVGDARTLDVRHSCRPCL